MRGDEKMAEFTVAPRRTKLKAVVRVFSFGFVFIYLLYRSSRKNDANVKTKNQPSKHFFLMLDWSIFLTLF